MMNAMVNSTQLIDRLLAAPSQLTVVEIVEDYVARYHVSLKEPAPAAIMKILNAFSPFDMDSDQWRNITTARVQLNRLIAETEK
ncbi:MAG: hypothetical protein QM731_08710 [Chitinophagaceae bacterium]